jgi:hypothetical protein
MGGRSEVIPLPPRFGREVESQKVQGMYHQKGIVCWLLAVRQRIGVKLPSWSVADLEFLVA